MSRRYGRKPSILLENLMTALAKAKDEGKEEFEYDGKTYKVSDFDDSEESGDSSIQETSEDGGEDVPSSKVEKPKSKRAPRGAASGSTAKDNLTTSESVWNDVSSRDFYGDIAAIFEGGDFSVEFLDRAHAVFESAVSERTREIAHRLEEEANLKLDSLVKEGVDDAVSQIDDYLSYVVREWKEENKIAIEKGIKADICESFMSGLKNLFEAHYIEMPESKYDALEDSIKKAHEFQESLNEQIKKNAVLSNQNIQAEERIREISGKYNRIVQSTKDMYERKLQESYDKYRESVEASKTLTACEHIFGQVSKDLTETQTEKLRSLAESIDFKSLDDFGNKLEMMKESMLGKKKRRGSSVLDEDHQSLDRESNNYQNARTSEYAKYLSIKSNS